MNKTPETKEIWTVRGLLAASILAGFGGIAAFLVLFLPDYNIYWFMLSPIILTFYELPAIYLFWLYRKKKTIHLRTELRIRRKSKA
ncbi:MAG: hypothetical protein R6V02_04120 [Candidatus Aminicenantes bacterium]